MSFASATAVPSRTARLRVMHVLRAPLGGLFRHVIDVTLEQVRRGHAVGLVTDASTGGRRAAELLHEIEPLLALGVTRVPMSRNPGLTDFAAFLHVVGRIRAAKPDIVHGHGSKGGLFARLPRLIGACGTAATAYTPHGGSFNYKPGTAIHALYMLAERALKPATDVHLFESDFIARRFREDAGAPSAPVRIALNGLGPDEFLPAHVEAGAHDFLYVGELRSAKGIDTLLDALALARDAVGRPLRLVLVGSGPDTDILRAQATRLGLEKDVEFAGMMAARRAFARGSIMVVPSRAESLPYVVLEAAAARVPLISTNVGGIPEIFGPHAARLIPPNDPRVLADRMVAMLGQEPTGRLMDAEALRSYVQTRFSVAAMTDTVLDGYAAAMARRGHAAQRIPPKMREA